ncbi:hypothetical protein [Flavobacterium sp.]|uniref:hypothetical protein n=1 Tax=Flavobacterium sp. TaxID=239 RepID=UPI002630D1EB|nr:hypothetical protein [Flavobacterium sp.]MDG2432078.1 hypothetical protein [Flavobacterium sp.]
MKNAFKTLLYNPNKKTEVFETIWGNQNLSRYPLQTSTRGSQVKNAFKTLLYNPNKKTEVFATIWGNQNLRKDLFPELPPSPSPQLARASRS